MAQTLTQFIKENEPSREGGKVYYWSHSVEKDHVSYTPFMAASKFEESHYDSSRKVIVPFPEGETVVTLPVPPWLYAWGEDQNAANIGATQMFLSEAKLARDEFIKELEELAL